MSYPEEEWKPVVGLEGHYEVSNLGRVRSARTKRGKVTGRNDRGYTIVRLWRDGKPKAYSVHRMVARAFLGPCPDGHEVNHKDGKRNNAAVENLEYLTHSDNMLHAYKSGLLKAATGPKDRSGWTIAWNAHPRKLDEEKVRAIREMAESTPIPEVAVIFELHRASVWAIVARKRWAHLL